MRLLFIAVMMLGPGFLQAAQQSGSVRAADRFIPGCTVTARNGAAKVVAYTDENGRYALDLAPGVWEIQIDMFGFAPLRAEVTVGLEPVTKEWTLEMPRPGAPAAAPAPVAARTEPAKPAAAPAAAEAKPAPTSAAAATPCT